MGAYSTFKIYYAQYSKQDYSGILNIIMALYDNDIENRKELFTKEAKECFQENVYVPDDLDEIEL